MRRPLLAALALLSLPALAACTQNTDGATDEAASSGTVTVASSDDACEVSSAKVPAGTVTFEVTNTGSQATEFYLLAADDERIVGEVENIGPQLSRQLVVDAPAGDYLTLCKPGMTGAGIRADFTVASSEAAPSASADEQRMVDRATGRYASFVQDQSAQLMTKTKLFVAAYQAGDDDRARALYPRARTHWERIEPVAESFGDLDPKLDLREADLEPGARWTGWHRLEKDLWPQRATGYTPLSDARRGSYADDLMRNTTTLDSRIQKLSYTVDQIANGSRGLMEEVAVAKVTGEEEHWSRTDLTDFQANVDGARVGFVGLKPILTQKDPELAASLTTRFAQLQRLLDSHRTSTGFVSYDDLSTADVKALADGVNALAEPLSMLTAAVLS